MPPHDVYIETHLGGGSVLINKKPARVNIGIDIDAETVQDCFFLQHRQKKRCKIYRDDAVRFVNNYKFTGGELIYCDPPYLLSTRKSGPLYKYEYTEQQHIELLETLKKLSCYVMISGYQSSLYESMLQQWHCISFDSMTRQGLATEYLWMNFKPTGLLHDYQYLGENFRERERIKRIQHRWKKRLQLLPENERMAILTTFSQLASPEMPSLANQILCQNKKNITV